MDSKQQAIMCIHSIMGKNLQENLVSERMGKTEERPGQHVDANNRDVARGLGWHPTMNCLHPSVAPTPP